VTRDLRPRRKGSQIVKRSRLGQSVRPRIVQFTPPVQRTDHAQPPGGGVQPKIKEQPLAKQDFIGSLPGISLRGATLRFRGAVRSLLPCSVHV
jgi:hypothetical protein